jgi:hypothetical protein
MASIDVEDVLSKLTEREKISLLAGRHFLSQSAAAFNLIMISQVSTFGTHNQSPNMVFRLYDSLMVPMVFAALASSTGPQQLASLAVQL